LGVCRDSGVRILSWMTQQRAYKLAPFYIFAPHKKGKADER